MPVAAESIDALTAIIENEDYRTLELQNERKTVLARFDTKDGELLDHEQVTDWLERHAKPYGYYYLQPYQAKTPGARGRQAKGQGEWLLLGERLDAPEPHVQPEVAALAKLTVDILTKATKTNESLMAGVLGLIEQLVNANAGAMDIVRSASESRGELEVQLLALRQDHELEKTRIAKTDKLEGLLGMFLASKAGIGPGAATAPTATPPAIAATVEPPKETPMPAFDTIQIVLDTFVFDERRDITMMVWEAHDRGYLDLAEVFSDSTGESDHQSPEDLRAFTMVSLRKASGFTVELVRRVAAMNSAQLNEMSSRLNQSTLMKVLNLAAAAA